MRARRKEREVPRERQAPRSYEMAIPDASSPEFPEELRALQRDTEVAE